MDISITLLVYIGFLVITSSVANRRIKQTEYIENHCGGIINIQTSKSISLSADLFYPTGWSCQTTLVVPRDHIIWLTFTKFDVGRPSIVYCTDVLRIYDGQDTKASELSPTKGLCGRTLPSSITSSGNKLTIRFRSHVVTTSTGFTMLVTAQRKVEEFTPCWKSEFLCKNFICIDEKMACDGQINCPEGEDESQKYAGCEDGYCCKQQTDSSFIRPSSELKCYNPKKEDGILAQWTDFPFTVKIGIIVGMISLVFLSACFIFVCCCTPKKRNKKLTD